MADLNALIAQGAQFRQAPDPFVQYGQMQQLEQNRQTNALNQMKMQEMQRGMETTNALNRAYQSNMNVDTGEINYPGVYKSLGSAGAGSSIPGIQKTQFEAEKERALLARTKQETFGLQNKAIGAALTMAMSNPTDAGLNQAFNMLDSQKIDTTGLRSQFANITDPTERLKAIQSYATAHPEGIAAMKFVAPDPLEITKGDGSKIFVDKNPNSPTYGKEILPPQAAGMTLTQAATVKTGQDRLDFDKAEAKWKKDNPGFKLQAIEKADGTTEYYAVNEITKVATRITLDGTPLTGVNLPAQTAAIRQKFDQDKLDFERKFPGFTIEKATQADGTIKFKKVNKLTGEATDVMDVSGTPLTGAEKTTVSPLATLLAERAKLIKAGVPLTDPRIQAYDQKIASGESQSTKLQRELQVAIANNASPEVIAQIKRDIRNLHPGLPMQNVTGVDAQGNQIVTRFAGTGGGSQGQFALNQAPTSTARAMLGLNEADSALLFGPGGAVEKGLVPVGRLTPSNARMFVAAVKANPNLNFTNLNEDQVSGLAQAKAEGTTKGRQVLTLADRSTAQNIANGNLPPLTGPNSSKIMNEVIDIKPDYRSGDYGLQTAAVKAFNQGTQGNKVRSLNVVTEHFNTLEKAANALQSGDVRAINAISQFIQAETGKPAPTDFNAVKEILADEIVAAVVPGVGALADRVALKKTILASRSPEQLKGVVAQYKELIGGQLNGLEKQYQAGTGRNDFKSRYLTSAAVQGLAPSSQYVEIKNLPDGRKLGKKADGTVEEIK